MAKHKQQKHDAAGAKATFGKMRRKEFEMELARLQVELTRLQTLVHFRGARIIVLVRGARHGRQGRRDQLDRRPA